MHICWVGPYCSEKPFPTYPGRKDEEGCFKSSTQESAIVTRHTDRGSASLYAYTRLLFSLNIGWSTPFAPRRLCSSNRHTTRNVHKLPPPGNKFYCYVVVVVVVVVARHKTRQGNGGNLWQNKKKTLQFPFCSCYNVLLSPPPSKPIFETKAGDTTLSAVPFSL